VPGVEDWAINFILGLVSESDELLRELHWRHHRRVGADDRTINWDNVAQELADITKYVICLWQEFGFTPEQMMHYVQLKSEVMLQRLKQEFALALPEGSQVLIYDLDGTLADFRLGLGQWLVQEGILPSETTDREKSLMMDVDLGIPYDVYWEAKRKFETQGGYRSLPEIPDGVSLVQAAQQAGIYTICTTARPTNLKRVWYDTWAWLADHHLKPDQLLLLEFDRVLAGTKLEEGECQVCLLEDNPEIALRAAQRINVLLMPHRYNQHLLGKSPRIRTFSKQYCHQPRSIFAPYAMNAGTSST
jgi:ligand-binding SRPBCC domain-containing protein